MRSARHWLPFFAADYFDARDAFLRLCAGRGIDVRSHECPAAGPQGECLTTEVARIGPPKASRVLVIVSGTHGVEALAGSACQLGWLADTATSALPVDVALVLVHILNPWGCVWSRRQNEDNVDLNRNFVDFSADPPPNPRYEELRDSLHCPQFEGPARAVALERIERYRRERGERAYATALFQGQYTDPAGIGFGGSAPTWSQRAMRQILRDEASGARVVALIDLHTGLGAYGRGAIINTSAARSRSLDLARRWYGPDIAAIGERPGDLPYPVHGHLTGMLERALAPAITVAVALEFGTYEPERLLRLQLDDCWLLNYGDVASREGKSIRAALRNFFCPDDPVWRDHASIRFAEVVAQALAGITTV